MQNCLNLACAISLLNLGPSTIAMCIDTHAEIIIEAAG